MRHGARATAGAPAGEGPRARAACPSAAAAPRRRLLLLAPALWASAAEADEGAEGADFDAGVQGFFCKGRCERDWCKANDDVCDCHAVLKARGYRVPLDAPSAYAKAGAVGWAASLGWEAANIPGWTALRGEQLEVAQSSLEGAGRGLFAREALPGGAVLPYVGDFLTFAEVGERVRTPRMSYTWCPRSSARAVKNMTQAELEKGPAARDMAFCIDASGRGPGSPARFINGANARAQCGSVNVDICELGGVMYFRTKGEVQPGRELIADYGSSYWKGFRGC